MAFARRNGTYSAFSTKQFQKSGREGTLQDRDAMMTGELTLTLQRTEVSLGHCSFVPLRSEPNMQASYWPACRLMQRRGTIEHAARVVVHCVCNIKHAGPNQEASQRQYVAAGCCRRS